jgi:hypothetical protein
VKPARPLLALLTSLILALPALASADTGWQQDANEKGVVVTTKLDAGRSLPIFRGVSVIDAGAYDILAVLDDIGKFPEWSGNCAEAHVVKQISAFERIGYNRVHAPWPVSDRDAAIHSWVEGSASKGEIWARFQSVDTPGAGPVDGVVRMPRLVGFYQLQVIDPGHTRVTYQVDADPGGILPDWLIKLTSSKLPIDTLVGLRGQVAKTHGKYEAFLKKYDPSKGGTVPAQFAK